MFSASSQARPAAIIGLTGNATAIPVDMVNVGAAEAAAAMVIHGVWPASVKTIPENSALSARRARSESWPDSTAPL